MSSGELSLKRKRVGRGVRPSQRFFIPFEWPDDVSKQLDDPDRWLFRGSVYSSRLLDLAVPINPLNLEIATPSRSELRLWESCPDDVMKEFATTSLRALAEEFWVDGRVEVISGDLQGRIGIVTKVYEESLSVLLWKDILGSKHRQGEASSVHIETIPSSVCKIKLGDYVEAVLDQDRPRRGFVVDICPTDGGRQTLTIMKNSCQNEVRHFLTNLDL
jgi:hypothetical protein